MMISYRAPDPYPHKEQNSLSKMFSLISSSSSFESVSKGIGKLVLPAQWRRPVKLDKTELSELASFKSLMIDGGFVGTHDGAVLDTIELTPKKLKNILDKHFIIKFNGNGGQYQDLIDDYASDASDLNCVMVGFNYRGVGESQKTPETFHDLVVDGIAQVQRLLDQGADSESILLDGHSLGGGVATMVAHHFHKRGLPVYLWNDRSFSSISKAAAGIIAPTLPGILGEAVESTSAFSSWSVMKPSGWDENVASAYLEIPEQYKGYMVVSKASSESAGDGVISHPASMHKAVRTKEKSQNISTMNKVNAPTLFGPGHNLPRRALISKQDPEMTGQDLFAHFVRKL